MAFKHTYLTKDGLETKELTMASAIRQKCLECCCWSGREIRLCTVKDCALYPVRFGKYPKTTEQAQDFEAKRD